MAELPLMPCNYTRTSHSLSNENASYCTRMFTPPPSPLPLRRPMSLELPPTRRDGASSIEYDDSDDSDAHSFIEEGSVIVTPPTPPPAPQLTLPNSIRHHKNARRRIWIPLLAVVLVCLAVGASTWGERSPAPAAKIFGLPPKKPHASSPESSSASHPRAPASGAFWRTHLMKHAGSLRRKRQVNANVAAVSGTSTSSAPAASSSLSSSSPSVVVGSATIPDPPNPVPTPFPQPFDTVFSYNFTTPSCQSFFADALIANITFRACRPLSLLLPASSAFIAAQSNLTLLTSVLGGTCDTTGATDAECLDTMAYLAEEIRKDSVCGRDLAEENALAVEALTGFENYGFMRQAGCLINQMTNSYCLVDAVASPSPSDFYYYTLPLGTPLPNNTTPSCSTCTESLLAIYATQAANASLLISKTYAAAADVAIKGCGARYAVALDATSGAAAARVGGRGLMVGLVGGLVVAGVLSLGI